MSNIPLTIQALNKQSTWSNRIQAGVNGSTLSLSTKDDNLRNAYWFVLVDRISLKVELDFTTQNNSDIPAQLKPYLGNTQYILLFSSQNLGSAFLPQGDLYNFLVSEGAGAELERLEQVYATFNCGTWGFMAYSFVGVLGDDGGGSFEAATIMENAILHTLQLHPIDVAGTAYYTPVAL